MRRRHLMANQASNQAVRPVYHITGQRDGKIIVSMSLGHTGQVTPIEITRQDGDLGYFNYVRFRVLQGELPEVKIDRDHGHLIVPDDYKALMKDNPVYLIVTDISYFGFCQAPGYMLNKLGRTVRKINPFFTRSAGFFNDDALDVHYLSGNYSNGARIALSSGGP